MFDLCRGAGPQADERAKYLAAWEALLAKQPGPSPRTMQIEQCEHRGGPGPPRRCLGCRGEVWLKTWACDHPDRPEFVTHHDCHCCPLFPPESAMPELTTDTPIPDVKARIATQPPGNWPAGFIDFPNVRQAFRELLDEHVANLPPRPEGSYHGRGIVVSVNAKSGRSSGKMLNQGYFPGAWVLVHELRRLGCQLPITFAYLGPLEWDHYLTRLVAPLGVTCLDLRECEQRDPMRILAGWETKVYAMLHAGYAECLFLDADNVPIHDPTYLFDDPAYQQTGAMFWPDVKPSRREEWLPALVWDSVGLAYRPYQDFESGQLLVDLSDCWEEMQVTRFLNEHSDYWYAPGHCFGDKSTWFLAWNKLGREYAIPQRQPGWNGGALIQHDMQGGQLFEHCVRNKPTIDGYPRQGCLTNPGEIAGHLAELKRLWQGSLWHNYGPEYDEAELADELKGQQFTYRRVGLGERTIELGPGSRAGGRITKGAAACEVRWDVIADAASVMHLAICAEEKPTCILREDTDGVWRGAWLEYERCPVELVPLSPRQQLPQAVLARSLEVSHA